MVGSVLVKAIWHSPKLFPRTHSSCLSSQNPTFYAVTTYCTSRSVDSSSQHVAESRFWLSQRASFWPSERLHWSASLLLIASSLSREEDERAREPKKKIKIKTMCCVCWCAHVRQIIVKCHGSETLELSTFVYLLFPSLRSSVKHNSLLFLLWILK